VEIAAECANGFDAVKAVAEQKAGPDLPGRADAQAHRLDVLELIGTTFPSSSSPHTIKHAMRAFEVHAVDYLLKPVGARAF